MGDSEFLKQELAKVKAELSILYEIGNAMHSTLKLDEILYIILTGVTSHAGLGFNRAMLFLVNDRENAIEGKMGIGPDTGEEADKIWKSIEAQRMTLDDLIDDYKKSKDVSRSQLDSIIKTIKLPLREDSSIVALTALEGMPLHITKDSPRLHPHDPIVEILKATDFVCVPLKTRDKAIGVILADNLFTQKPITNDDMRMLTMFANQAGLAIEKSRLYEETLLLANTDYLTRLGNHGHFQSTLEREIKKAKQDGIPLSLIMMDIDNFKNYNDTLGHLAGDKVLREIGWILKDTSRKTDFAARYGGEEFALILPCTAGQEALIVSEKLRKRIEEYRFEREDIQPGGRLTVSCGIATLLEQADNKEELISQADKALYEAKRSGRNKSCVYK
jgi:diguanylate cyclase (GGDEF)-like protein